MWEHTNGRRTTRALLDHEVDLELQPTVDNRVSVIDS
jgi:hypothetical protein